MQEPQTQKSAKSLSSFLIRVQSDKAKKNQLSRIGQYKDELKALQKENAGLKKQSNLLKLRELEAENENYLMQIKKLTVLLKQSDQNSKSEQ